MLVVTGALAIGALKWLINMPTRPYEYEICIAQTGTYSKYMETTCNKN